MKKGKILNSAKFNHDNASCASSSSSARSGDLKHSPHGSPLLLFVMWRSTGTRGPYTQGSIPASSRILGSNQSNRGGRLQLPKLRGELQSAPFSGANQLWPQVLGEGTRALAGVMAEPPTWSLITDKTPQSALGWKGP